MYVYDKDTCLKIEHLCFVNSLWSSCLSSYSFFSVPSECRPAKVHRGKKDKERFFIVDNLNLPGLKSIQHVKILWNK